MVEIRRLVLDVLKPHEPPMIELTEEVAHVEGVEGVNISLVEVDEEVRNIKITVEGEINIDKIREVIENKGGRIHSIDQVAAGKSIVEEINTPQD